MAIASVTITCTCCGREFEHRHKCYNRRDADEYEAWAERNITLCPECRKAQYEEQKNAERAEACKGYALPALTGSEKQIAWAEKLRAAWITSAEKFFARFEERDPDGIAEARRALNILLAEKTESKFWIDTRDEDYFNIMRTDSVRVNALRQIVADQRAAAAEQPAESEQSAEPETTAEPEQPAADPEPEIAEDHPVARLTALGYRFSDVGENHLRRPDGKDELYVAWQDGKLKFLPWIPDKVVYFTCGGRYTVPDGCVEAGMTATVSDLYADFFRYDAEQRFRFDHKMSRRSWEYLEAAKIKLGLVSSDEVEDARPKLYVPHNGEDESEKISAEYVRVGHHDGALGELDGAWLMELYEGGVLGSCVFSFRFDHRPSEEDMDDAWAIHELTHKAANMDDVNYWHGDDLVTEHWTKIDGRPSEVLDRLSRCWF